MLNTVTNQNRRFPVSSVQSDNVVKNKIPTSKAEKDNSIIFSMKHLKCTSVKNSSFNNCFYSISVYANWITLFLKKITEFSSMSVQELSQGGKSTRFHTVEDGDLAKLKKIVKEAGLDVDKLFKQEESNSYYELSFGTSRGRMFGYLAGNTYYILLIDPHHLVYPNYSKGAKEALISNRYDPWTDSYINNSVI